MLRVARAVAAAILFVSSEARADDAAAHWQRPFVSGAQVDRLPLPLCIAFIVVLPYLGASVGYAFGP
jgi:hypothetical protein